MQGVGVSCGLSFLFVSFSFQKGKTWQCNKKTETFQYFLEIKVTKASGWELIWSSGCGQEICFTKELQRKAEGIKVMQLKRRTKQRGLSTHNRIALLSFLSTGFSENTHDERYRVQEDAEGHSVCDASRHCNFTSRYE